MGNRFDRDRAMIPTRGSVDPGMRPQVDTVFGGGIQDPQVVELVLTVPTPVQENVVLHRTDRMPRTGSGRFSACMNFPPDEGFGAQGVGIVEVLPLVPVAAVTTDDVHGLLPQHARSVRSAGWWQFFCRLFLPTFLQQWLGPRAGRGVQHEDVVELLTGTVEPAKVQNLGVVELDRRVFIAFTRWLTRELGFTPFVFTRADRQQVDRIGRARRGFAIAPPEKKPGVTDHREGMAGAFGRSRVAIRNFGFRRLPCQFTHILLHVVKLDHRRGGRHRHEGRGLPVDD